MTAKMQWSLILLFLCCFIDCQLYQFHYINENKNWTEAQQYCREKHTDLVTVTNMKDMKRLINISAGDQSDHTYIGLFRDTWRWSDGSSFSFRHWNPIFNNHNPNSGQCAMTKFDGEGRWTNVNCDNKKPFICYDETNTTHKYHLIKEEKSWQEAQSYCREKHTDLISGMKQLQDEEVKKLLNSNYQPYIGLFRDTWRWSDGSSFSFRHWNPNKLILIKEAMNWEDALTYCRGHHYNLVTITNVDDQKQIQEKVKEASTDYVWMGLRYACTLDLWFWVSDEMVSDENWAKGEPMDDCDMSGAMETGGEHQWKKKNDTEKFNFICSKN
uniref:C-type lectin domain-containing protein n=1 Tax=Poecilia formosa TaxID=48698 RepID=A0A096LXG3_POEFO